MSVAIEISESRLRLGFVKLALGLVMVFLVFAFGVSSLAGKGQGVAVNALLICLAFGFLTNGVLAALRVVDWFEARKRRG